MTGHLGPVALRPLLAQGLPLSMLFFCGWSYKTKFSIRMQVSRILIRIGAGIFAQVADLTVLRLEKG